jgi:hypothetical protein
LPTTSFTNCNSTETRGGSKTTYLRRARATPHDGDCAVGSGLVGVPTMGVPLEIPPLPNVVLTLSTMLGLFAYVYRLAGKDRPPDARA